MKIRTIQELPSTINTIILPFQQGKVDPKKIARYAGIKTTIDFQGKFKESLLLYHPTKKCKIFLLGLGGKKEEAKCSDAFRNLAFKQQKNWSKNILVDIQDLPQELGYHAALGLQLATYQIGKSQPTKLAKSKVAFLQSKASKKAKVLLQEGIFTGETQIEMMKLVNAPGNEKTPSFIADYALQSGKRNGFKVTILKKKALEKEGLHAVLAVGNGSQHEPVLIKLEYQPKKKTKTPLLGLVGKGITFDTGGLSIKGATNMHYMKSDMGGAAAVLGGIELAAKLQLPISLVGIIPSAENAVDAKSVKPGDVINSYSGKTIEVIDTDAEGRLILADGLAYIQKNYQPDIILDVATLTGSTVRALGYAAGGLFTSNRSLAADLMEVGQQTHERLWPFPLWEDYDPDIASDVADVRNFSGKMVAGAITAGKFLEFFIKDHPRWAHLDIAGVAFGSSEYSKMKSATGYGVRLLLAYMKRVIGEG